MTSKWFFKTMSGRKYGPFQTEERARESFEDWVLSQRRNLKVMSE